MCGHFSITPCIRSRPWSLVVMVPVTGFTARKSGDSRGCGGVLQSGRASEKQPSAPAAVSGSDCGQCPFASSRPLPSPYPLDPFPGGHSCHHSSTQPSMRHDVESIRLSLMEATASARSTERRVHVNTEEVAVRIQCPDLPRIPCDCEGIWETSGHLLGHQSLFILAQGHWA